MALLVGWTIVNPERSLRKLHGLQLSNFARIAVIGLLPIGVVSYLGDLQLGLPTNGLYPFVLFVLGWAGTPARSTLGLIVGFGAVGIASHFLMPSWEVSPLSVWYWPNSIAGILYVALYYLAGVVLNHVSFGISSNQSAQRLDAAAAEADRAAGRSVRAFVNWSVSQRGFIALGIIMFMASIGISMKLGSITLDIWYGDDYLLMFAAFVAGALWGNRGMQLTFGVVAVLSLLMVLSSLSPAAASLSDGIGIGPLLIRFPTRPDKIFPLVAFSALLYALLGMRLATWFAEHRRMIPTLR